MFGELSVWLKNQVKILVQKLTLTHKFTVALAPKENDITAAFENGVGLCGGESQVFV